MKKALSTPKAPSAIGPYSQAIAYGDLLFTSGQVGADPVSGQLAEGVEAQARLALANLQAILEAAGTSCAAVLKTTVFITDMANFAAVNKVYAEFFPEPFPGRSCVAVAQLPKGALVEVEAIAGLAG